MTQEDKAKRYDEALELARDYYKANSKLDKEDENLILEDIFPELAESEDEKIRKALLEHIVRIDSEVPLGAYHRLNGVDISEIIAWLEKQDSKTNPYSGVSFEYNGHIWGMCARDNGVDIVLDKQLFKHLEKQEQKPIKLSENDKKIRSAIYRYLDWLDGKKDCAPQEEYTVRDMKIWLTDFLYPDIKAERQGEQKHLDYPYIPGWRENRPDNKPQIKHSVLMLTTHGVAEGEWLGEEWCQYRWSCKVKDADVLYWLHLSDLESLEKEGEQKPDWSEEDKYMIDNLIRIFERNPDEYYKAIRKNMSSEIIPIIYSSEIIDWLKSLKQRIGE